MEFIGLKNFRDLFHDHILITALKNNIIYILIVVGMQIVLGFVTAVLLSYVKSFAVLSRPYTLFLQR